jgi:hypothetical protein
VSIVTVLKVLASVGLGVLAGRVTGILGAGLRVVVLLVVVRGRFVRRGVSLTLILLMSSGVGP